MRGPLLALALATLGRVSLADPLPVHTPTTGSGRPSSSERLAVANAVSEVLSPRVPEVLSGEVTRTRLQTLSPSSLACAEPRCAVAIATALRARGVVLVTLEPQHRGRRLRLALRVVNLRGEVVAEADGEESIPDWADAVALGRAVATELLPALRAADPGTPTPLPTPAPPADPRPPREAGHELRPPAITAPTTRSRPLEALLGAALIAGGGVSLALGAVALSEDGDQVGQPCDAVAHPERACEELHALAPSYVAVIVGGAAVLGGAFLVWDGLRQRPVRPAPSLAPRVDATPLPGGGMLTLRAWF